jgi:hypothetical protein
MRISRKCVGVMILPTLWLASLCADVQAQQVFRCGSKYQDRPCDSGPPSQEVKGISQNSASATSPAPVADASCAKRGAEAQQIMWAREAGKTAEAQTAQATSDERRRLIADVFNRRGSAMEVRNAVQANCMEEKAQAAQAAAMLAAAMKAQGAASAAPPGAPNSAPASAGSQTEQQATADNKNLCNNLNAQLESIRQRQRSGGNAKAMDSLSQQRQTIEKKARDAGC